MLRRLILAAISAALMLAPAATASAAGVEPAGRIELSKVMGRWYEVARVPNSLQTGCQAGASDWTPQSSGFAVVQSCHKGSPTGPQKTWKAKATVADPRTNA
jgi:apolipoprotein D and lipocalin family protein